MGNSRILKAESNASASALIYKYINGKNVPLVFYMLDDTPITLAVICNSNIDFSKMKEVMADKMVVYTGTGFCGSCQIVGWKETNTQYVIVSMLNREIMIKALTKA